MYKSWAIVVLIWLSFGIKAFSADTCWKSSEIRGAGTIPDDCGALNKSGLLCYPNCKPGYSLLAGVCWQQCPDGWKDDGGHCRKPDSYSRGVLWLSMDKCNNDKGKAPYGCENSFGAVYPKCKPGYVAAFATECSNICPADMVDIGVSCQKNSYIVAPVAPQCGDKEWDGGLCYKKCAPLSKGIGPVCWGTCPSGSVDCGAMCGKTKEACALTIGNQVFSVARALAFFTPLFSYINAAYSLTNLTNMSPSAVSAFWSAIASYSAGASNFGINIVGTAGEAIRNGMKKDVSPEAVDELAKAFGDPENAKIETLIKAIRTIDFTGVTSAIDSFRLNICK